MTGNLQSPREERFSLIFELLKQQRTMTDPDAIMSAASELLGRHLQADRVGFYEMPDDETLNFTVGWSNGRVPLLSGPIPASCIGSRLAAEARCGIALGIADVSVHPWTVDSQFTKTGVRAAIGLSLLREGKWHAGLYVNQSEVRNWTDDEVELASEVAEIAWDAVKRERALQDLHRVEAVLIQSEKLATVGRLASSIAHEINNPLASVTNLLYLARSSSPSPEVEEYLSVADRELRRVAAITNQTLRFPKQTSEPIDVHCHELIDSVLTIHHGRMISARIEVQKRNRAKRPVRCFEGEIRQVVSNLVTNAIDATPSGGGRLLLRCRETEHHKSGSPGLVITIADTGLGMSPQTAARVFEPFFTTKGTHGTGLGLWISKEIIGKHRGSLKMRSSQRKGSSGTVISLFLPFQAAA